MPKPTEPKMVRVLWEDANMGHHWQDGHKPALPEPEFVFSVGYLHHSTKKHLVLTQSIADNQHANTLQIPKKMLISVEYLQPIVKENKHD